jgi:hypothetical protein
VVMDVLTEPSPERCEGHKRPAASKHGEVVVPPESKGGCGASMWKGASGPS